MSISLNEKLVYQKFGGLLMAPLKRSVNLEKVKNTFILGIKKCIVSNSNQSITTPDGLIVSAFGPALGKDHDRQLLTDSKIEARLMQLLGDIGYEGCLGVIIPSKGTRPLLANT
jgi:hypothetical protein